MQTIPAGRLALVVLLAGVTGACAIEDRNELQRRRANASRAESDFVESAGAPEGDLEAAVERAGSSDVNGDPVFEGDIVMPGSTMQNIASAVSAVKRWPSGVIPYEIDPALPEPERFRTATDLWELKTGIRFAARTNEADFVRVVDGDGCYSYIGVSGGMQKLQLGKLCTAGNAMHEIGHAVGLWHEHSRSDRDEFVTVFVENVAAGYAYAFDKTTFKSIGSYDIGSIMQYGSLAFAKADGKYTIVKKDGSPITANRSALSDSDIAGVNELYADQKLPLPREKMPGGDEATTTDPVNLRSGSSTNDAVIATIPAGSTVHLTGKSENGFLSVTFQDKSGWAYGQYLAPKK